ncbi:MAG: dihydrodipicolinate synthase family protein [Arachnia sp.]
MQQPEILSAVTTPFSPDGEVDLAALTANLRRIEPLVDGVFAAGTTGEFLALSQDEHEEIITAALEAFGPNRVVVHVGAASTRDAVALARQSSRLGATRFAAITPYYLKASTEGILRHWSAINEACDGDLYGYVFPDVAVTDLLPEDLPRVLASGIKGIKVSATASGRVDEYLAHAPEGFQLWSGNDADVPHVMAAGGTGTVSGVSGAVPGPWAALRDAMAAGDQEAADKAQAVIARVVPVLGPSIANLKVALDRQGLTGGTCRMVIDAPTPETLSQIDEVVALANQS